MRIQTNLIQLNIKTLKSKNKIQKFMKLSSICFERVFWFFNEAAGLCSAIPLVSDRGVS